MSRTDTRELQSAVEAVLFASGEPVPIERLASALCVEAEQIEQAAKALSDEFAFQRRGVRVVREDDCYQMCSSPEYADLIRLVLETRKMPQLSPAALEALAIVAYFQPVTKAYIEQIRGVDCTYTVKLLCDRGLIEDAGRLEVPGRPVLYKTTKAFLRTFALEDLGQLPELPEQQPDEEGQNKLLQAIEALRQKQQAEDTP